MYDYVYDALQDVYLLIANDWVVGTCKKERDAYFWYCKKNGYEYETNIKFDDEQ